MVVGGRDEVRADQSIGRPAAIQNVTIRIQNVRERELSRSVSIATWAPPAFRVRLGAPWGGPAVVGRAPYGVVPMLEG